MSEFLTMLFPITMLSAIVIGYFAVKNQWKIVDWF